MESIHATDHSNFIMPGSRLAHQQCAYLERGEEPNPEVADLENLFYALFERGERDLTDYFYRFKKY